jgi:hypothetical protein
MLLIQIVALCLVVKIASLDGLKQKILARVVEQIYFVTQTRIKKLCI